MSVTSPAATRTALKEWAVAVKALDEGTQVLLLRKGGIHEKEFALAREPFFLYPTYEHQRAELIQSHAQPALDAVLAAPPPPDSLVISSWALATEAHELTRPEQLAALTPLHLWTADYVQERLRWRPTKPLLALVLRVYRLAEPVTLPVISAHGGCVSRVDLEQAIPLEPSVPVLDDETYAKQAEAVRQALKEVKA